MDKLLKFVSGCFGAGALPAACFFLRSLGPANRVVFYDYLPLEELALALFAGALGAALGVSALQRLRKNTQPLRRSWLQLQLGACALLALWLLWPQLFAFPAHASVADRDAWARRNVRHYAALARVARTLPELQRDAGRIRAIAPAGSDQHRFAREMDGDDMIFALEVVGERGTGTLRVNCTLDDFMIYDWRSATWTFAGGTTRIDTIPTRVPAGP